MWSAIRICDRSPLTGMMSGSELSFLLVLTYIWLTERLSTPLTLDRTYRGIVMLLPRR